MLVFYKARLAFLSVPKTGSTAYIEALSPLADIVFSGPPQLKHAPVYRYDRFVQPMLKKVCQAEMEVLAVMRAPLDWLGSWYRYRRRPDLSEHIQSTSGISFDEFVRAHLQDSPPEFAAVGRQSRFLEAGSNGSRVTYLFAYEHPERLTRFLQQRLEHRFETQRLNVSPAGDLDLDPATERLFAQHYAADIKLYEHALNRTVSGYDP
ncbi:MAG: gamma-glutamyl kinase [Roseobacter sp.]